MNRSGFILGETAGAFRTAPVHGRAWNGAVIAPANGLVEAGSGLGNRGGDPVFLDNWRLQSEAVRSVT